VAINWKVTREDADTIRQIVERAVEVFNIEASGRQTLTMDITAAHLNGCPLDLPGLLAAEAFDFTHDIAGIARHMDRETGKIGGAFLPRYAARVAAEG
jgi:hypothetical protein